MVIVLVGPARMDCHVGVGGPEQGKASAGWRPCWGGQSWLPVHLGGLDLVDLAHDKAYAPRTWGSSGQSMGSSLLVMSCSGGEPCECRVEWWRGRGARRAETVVGLRGHLGHADLPCHALH